MSIPLTQFARTAFPSLVVNQADAVERLAHAFHELPELDQNILIRRFGLDGSSREPLGQIAESYPGKHPEWVRQVEARALRRLQTEITAPPVTT